MLRKLSFVFLIIFTFVQCRIIAKNRSIEDVVQLVNPLMGTDSDFSLSNGNTYPAIAVPWGMNFWSPQTGKMGDGWMYAYDATKIRGIKQTHQPSPWINDYGAFSIMATTGQLKIDEEERASWFSHKAETVLPNYYSVYLADYDVTAEVSPTDRAAIFRFTFPENDQSHILLDAFNGGSGIQIIPEERKIVGYCKNNHGGVPANFKNYFVAVFDKDFSVSQVWKEKELLQNLKIDGDHVGAAISFKTHKGEIVTMRIASSFISIEQAELNLHQELKKFSFDEVKQNAANIWRTELSKIKVEGGTIDERKTFYSCLYRVLLFPRKFYEIDAKGDIIHYSPYNGNVSPGYMFTDNGFWDTFRAVFPLFTLVYPEQNSQIMQGLVNTYQESGWLPEWASPGHRECMIGSNSASLIVDSYMKGIRGYDIDTLFAAILKNTTSYNKEVKSVGRYGADYYNKIGYVPYNVGINENAARTLEYAYDDFCIWKLAKELGKSKETIDLFQTRSQNYRNVFDPSVKLMRGKNEDGSFQIPFNPVKWGDAFTEGNSLHYTWSVFHDVQGLIGLMGGDKDFVSMLDSVFTMPPKFDCSYYGFPIHEIREMQIVNMGNYAHGNQPVQHMVYLYNYARQPWKTQQRVREILHKLYTPMPDGYCGDEDNGQTSAWYVFSSMGFYPVCPGTNEYVIGSPLFDRITIELDHGKKFVIGAKNNSEANIYVDQIKFQDKVWNNNFISHESIVKGGKMEFRMSDVPNKNRGISDEAKPFSMSGN